MDHADHTGQTDHLSGVCNFFPLPHGAAWTVLTGTAEEPTAATATAGLVGGTAGTETGLAARAGVEAAAVVTATAGAAAGKPLATIVATGAGNAQLVTAVGGTPALAWAGAETIGRETCLLYTSPSPRD